MTEFVVSDGNEMRPDDGWTGEMNEHTHTDDPVVAAVLAAAAAPAEGPVPGEALALAAFRSVYQPHKGVRMSRFSDKAKLIAAAIFGGVVVISGAAGAATGSLPLVSHGQSHSHPTPKATHTPDGDDDQGTDVENSTDDTAAPDSPGDNGKGAAVSELAHETPPPGTTRGQNVCTFASDGHCQAGQHGQSDADTHGKAHDNTSSLNHRQNTQTTHGKAHVNDNSLSHRQNSQTTHGKAHSGA
jgi:hypothetical protein